MLRAGILIDRRRLQTVSRLVVLIAFAAIIAGIIFEQVAERRERNSLPRTGRAFDIGGRSLNLYCSGTGAPTVLFESNGGIPGYRWIRVQREVATFTPRLLVRSRRFRVERSRPISNHSDSIAHDLHDLLTAAKITPPYVLVGHAMGAFHVRVFRSFYPAEVAGLILVDPMNEDMTIHVHSHNELFRSTVLFILRAVSAVGLPRLLRGSPGPTPNGWTQQEWDTRVELSNHPKSRLAAAQELPLWVNGELARAGRCYGDLLVTVLSAGVQDQEEDPKLDHDHAWKLELHERLARLSTRGTHIIVPSSGHDIPDEAPDAVVGAIQKMVQLTSEVPRRKSKGK
jgi:pimeloyl-ACP methyl ester carboxylesterase